MLINLYGYIYKEGNMNYEELVEWLLAMGYPLELAEDIAAEKTEELCHS